MSNNDDFGTFGRYQETPVAEMSPEMKDAYDFTVKLRGQIPGPHKIWVANPTLSKTIVPAGYYYQRNPVLRKPRSKSSPIAVGWQRMATTSMRRSA